MLITKLTAAATNSAAAIGADVDGALGDAELGETKLVDDAFGNIGFGALPGIIANAPPVASAGNRAPFGTTKEDGASCVRLRDDIASLVVSAAVSPAGMRPAGSAAAC